VIALSAPSGSRLLVGFNITLPPQMSHYENPNSSIRQDELHERQELALAEQEQQIAKEIAGENRGHTGAVTVVHRRHIPGQVRNLSSIPLFNRNNDLQQHMLRKQQMMISRLQSSNTNRNQPPQVFVNSHPQNIIHTMDNDSDEIGLESLRAIHDDTVPPEQDTPNERVDGEDQHDDINYYEEATLLDEDELPNTSNISTSIEQTIANFMNSLPVPPQNKNQRKIPVLYNIDRASCGTTEASEKKWSSVWPYWTLYCQQVDRPVIVDLFGLDLYCPKAQDFTVNSSPSCEDYDQQHVLGFYKFLLRDDVFSVKTTIINASLFLNPHLRAEYYSRLKNAGTTNPRLGAVKVGENLAVKMLTRSATKQQAKTNVALKLDLQADVDGDILPTQSQLMLEMALGKI
jgi:hypothetical protein